MIPESCLGELSVLNCGLGDLEFKFDNGDPQETVRAKRVIEDMLRRGYMLFVHVGKKLVQVKEFDAKRELYIIADGPLYAGDQHTVSVDEATATEPKHGNGRRKRGIPLKGTKAVGVAPTAGG